MQPDLRCFELVAKTPKGLVSHAKGGRSLVRQADGRVGESRSSQEDHDELASLYEGVGYGPGRYGCSRLVAVPCKLLLLDLSL
jgi:hypothetical protein